MSSKFLNVDTDGTLSGNSDTTIASQKAVKTYVDQSISDVEAQLPTVATLETAGLVKPDGETITVSPNGVLTALGGGGGDSGDSMQHIFGTGVDGGLTISANTSFSEPKDFTTLTINEGVTLSHTLSSNALLLIRCTTACYINGSIDMSGKGYQGGEANAAEARYQGKGSSLPVLWAGGGTNFPGGYPIGGVNQGGFGAGSGGASGGIANTAPSKNGGNFDLTRHKYFAEQLIFDQMPLLGGGGSGTGSVAGGNGGGGILIFAPVITFGANAHITSNGSAGANGTKASGPGGGGGGGGSATFVCKSCTGTPITSFSGGSGGTGSSTFGSGVAGGNGGNGGMFILVLR